uniref:Uncharacterized protein n=1 Tax=Arion vulgaris TaxID=1028688 RepID=A0A0B6YBR4_9EUPU
MSVNMFHYVMPNKSCLLLTSKNVNIVYGNHYQRSFYWIFQFVDYKSILIDMSSALGIIPMQPLVSG